MILVENPLLESEGLFFIAECFHILGFALSIGTIAVVDFCALGAGPSSAGAGRLAKSLAPWTLAGLADMLLTGSLLYLGNDGAAHYLYNPAFRFKMACLIAALTFHYTVHSKATNGNTSTGISKVVAVISLVLWLGVLAGGLFIAFAIG